MTWPVRCSRIGEVSASRAPGPDELAHPGAHAAVEARVGEQAHVVGGHAHHDRALRQVAQSQVGVQLGQPDHLRAGQQRAVGRHEQAVHVEDRQHVQQHVVLAPAPVVVQHAGVGGKVAMREHCPLAASGGAGGVQDGRQVVGLARHGLEGLRLAASAASSSCRCGLRPACRRAPRRRLSAARRTSRFLLAQTTTAGSALPRKYSISDSR